MLQKIKINDLEYPFYFGMREVYKLTTANNLEFHEATQRVSVDFDLFLELYHMASKKGVRKMAKEEGVSVDQYNHLVLSEQQIEDFIDEDPDVFEKLEEIFAESAAVKKMFDKADEKKTKPTPNH